MMHTSQLVTVNQVHIGCVLLRSHMLFVMCTVA